MHATETPPTQACPPTVASDVHPTGFLISHEGDRVPIPPGCLVYLKAEVVGQRVALSKSDIDYVFDTLGKPSAQKSWNIDKIMAICNPVYRPMVESLWRMVESISNLQKVKPPVLLTGVLVQDNKEVLLQYYKTGKVMAISGNELLASLEQCIRTIKNTWWSEYYTSNMPFVVLDGSLGIGKTQMAFSLNSDVIYLVWEYAHYSQPIYECWKSLSETFMECMKRDVGNWMADRETCPYSEDLRMSGKAFWTIAWFHWCLAVPAFQFPNMLPFSLLGRSFNDSIERPMTIAQFHAAWPDTPGGNNKPTVFIDEIPTVDDITELIFIRNLCRDYPSRIISAPHLWCYLFTHPSRASLSSLRECWVPDVEVLRKRCYELQPNFGEFIDYCTKTSRALLVMTMFTHLRDLLPPSSQSTSSSSDSPHQALLVLNALFCRMHKTLTDDKPQIYEEEVGQAGQILLFFPAQKSINTEFLSHHFAHLFLDGDYVPYYKVYTELGSLYYHTSEKSARVTKLTPLCSFPTLVEEPLLFLSLCGNRQISPFLNKKKHRIPLVEAWPAIFPFSTSIVDPSKPSVARELQGVNPLTNQQPRLCTLKSKKDTSGNTRLMMEHYAGVAVSAASHRGGFQGQSLARFLHSLLFHLYGESSKPCSQSSSGNLCCRIWRSICRVSTDKLMKRVIPFLSTHNNPFTEGLSCLDAIPGAYVDDLIIAKNSKDIDLKGGKIVIECKDWKKGFPSNQVESVIRKFKQHKYWRLGIIFCRKIPKKYRSLPTKIYEKQNISLFSVRIARGKSLVTHISAPKKQSRIILILPLSTGL
ncbi:hypothetical protein Pelo_7353 [Pelomyxa schiedti]|nr:hypothetical protein Pelo_7353 [Pelomyxa schiedti]